VSDKTTRTGVHLPPRVRRGERPQAATINGILDALGPRTLRIGRGGRPVQDVRAAVSLFQDGTYNTNVDPLPFDSPVEHETDALIIESSDEDSDTSPDTVTVHADGIYIVHISAWISCIRNASFTNPVGVVYVYRNGDTEDAIASAGLQLLNLDIRTGETEAFVQVAHTGMRDTSLSADDYLNVAIGIPAGAGSAEVSNIRFGVRLYQLL
jgi:hypothetical protein